MQGNQEEPTLIKTPSMSEISPSHDDKMPTVERVEQLSHRHVCMYLVSIRKSIFKSQSFTELMDKLSGSVARHYLKLLVTSHYAGLQEKIVVSKEIRKLEQQMIAKVTGNGSKVINHVD